MISESQITTLIENMKRDYQQRFRTPLVSDAPFLKIQAAADALGIDIMRAAWNEYISDPANEDTVDLGKFLWSSVLNKYARIVGFRLAVKSGAQKEVYFYHCENCNNQEASDTDRGDCLPVPCSYCKSRMIRRELYERNRPLSPGGERIKQRMIRNSPTMAQVYELWDKYPDKTLKQIHELLPAGTPKASIGFQKVVDKFTGQGEDLDDTYL